MKSKSGTKRTIHMERFVYSKAQAETAYKYLDANEWNVIKVFDVIWREKIFSDAAPHQAGMVLDIVDKIATIKKLEGRNFEIIWDAFIRKARTGTFDRIHLRPPPNEVVRKGR